MPADDPGGTMRVDAQVPILNVSDMAASFAWFAKLGWRKLWDYGEPPEFGAVGNGGSEIFLCLDGQGCRADAHGHGGIWASWFVSERAAVDAAHALALREGLEVLEAPYDAPWGMRECVVRHPDGHAFRIGAGVADPDEFVATVRAEGPPLRIERVEVPVRLERRLAALLHDLAEHKRMTIAECLEEILLHTCERLGAGVASPHTGRTLDHLQVLKRKHGIDYDCHASYRFVE